MAEETVTATVEATPAAQPFNMRDSLRTELSTQSAPDQAPEDEVKGDDTSDTPPAEDTKTEDQPSETVPTEDTLLTAEEVSKLSGKELDLYKKAQKNYTVKTQQLAAQRKELEPYQELINALKDPTRAKDAALQLAQHYGVLQTEAAAPPQAKPVEIAPELEFMRPMFQAFKDEAKAEALAELKAELAPIKTQTNELVTRSMAEATAATLTTFGKTHEGWEKHEAKMLEIAQQIQPTGNMSELDYLDTLYKLATHGVQSAEKTKQVVDRMKKAAAVAETPVSGVQSERVEYARPSTDSDWTDSRSRFKKAHEAGKRGQKWA